MISRLINKWLPSLTPDVHINWHMTPEEWRELRSLLLDNQDLPYIAKLKEEGALK